MYEVFEHTADLGLRIRAPDLDTLFAEAGAALFSVVVADLGSVATKDRFEVRLSSDQCDYLLFDWLKELLYKFDTEHMLFSRFQAHVHKNGVEALALGEPIDRARHVLSHEVKAI